MAGVRTFMAQGVGYLLSGGTAAVISVLIYALFVKLGMWYVAASVLTDILGLILVFLFNKYLVFQKRDRIIPHAARYIAVQILNTVLQVCIIYFLVEHIKADKVLARVLSIGACVPLNFVLYKWFVYV